MVSVEAEIDKTGRPSSIKVLMVILFSLLRWWKQLSYGAGNH